MFKNSDDVLKYIKDNDVKMVDVRFCDLPGVMQHFNIPVESVDESLFDRRPDVRRIFDPWLPGHPRVGYEAHPGPRDRFLDPFRTEKTLVMNFSIRDPFTDEPYSRDPRQIATKAEAYLKSTGIADTAYFGAEAEFYVFDDVRFETKQNAGYYYIDSIEGAWNTGREEEGGNRGYKTRYKGGYFPVPPVDHFADLRDAMVRTLVNSDFTVERSHHEVGTAGQAEINYRFNTLLHAADDMMRFKYIIKNVAWAHGRTATFMPKPLFGDNGSGMHTHQSLYEGRRRRCSTTNSATRGCRTSARWYIGGLLAHAPARAGVHQPDGELLPPPGARLRGSGEPGLQPAQPLGLHPHPDHRQQRQGQAHRVPRAGPVVQPVPGVRGDADGRPGRHQEQDRAARPGRQGPVRAAAGRGRRHPAGPGLAGRRARRA